MFGRRMPVRAHHVNLKLHNESYHTYDRESKFREKAQTKVISQQNNLFPQIDRSRSRLSPILDRQVSTPKRIYFKGDPNSRNYKDSTPSIGLSYGVAQKSGLYIDEKERFKQHTKNYGKEEKELPSHSEVRFTFLCSSKFNSLFLDGKEKETYEEPCETARGI